MFTEKVLILKEEIHASRESWRFYLICRFLVHRIDTDYIARRLGDQWVVG